MADRAKLLDAASAITWFHAIDFGDCQTPGRFTPGTPQNRTLFGVMDLLNHVDLAGLDCLDIGAMDGLIAFNMAMHGARVVGTDMPADGYPSFQTARQLLGLDVEMVGDTTFENIMDRFGEHQFDVVVCAGVMYHMLNPFDCFLKARRLLKRNGLLLLQTRYHPDDERPTLDLNLVSRRLDQITVFWVPSRSALEGMLALGGFELLAVRSGTRHSFITMIARNSDLTELDETPGLIEQQHHSGIPFPEFRHELPQLPEQTSQAIYRGPRDDVVIDDLAFQPDFPPHPTEEKPLVGARRVSPNKNYKPWKKPVSQMTQTR